MAPPSPPQRSQRRHARLAAPLTLAVAAAGAGYIATLGLGGAHAWVGPASPRLGVRRSVAAQAMMEPEVQPYEMTEGDDRPRGRWGGGGPARDMDNEGGDYYDERAGRRRGPRDDDFEADDDAPDRHRGRKLWTYKTPIEELKVGQEFEGTVRSIQRRKGAWVDIGAEQKGFLRILEVDADWKPGQKFPVDLGDKLHVRILEINLEKRDFAVTCLPGDLHREPTKWFGRAADMTPFLPQTIFEGVIESWASMGAFVSVNMQGGEPVTGVIYTNDIPERVRRSLEIGDKVKMKVCRVHEKKKQVGFKVIDDRAPRGREEARGSWEDEE